MPKPRFDALFIHTGFAGSMDWIIDVVLPAGITVVGIFAAFQLDHLIERRGRRRRFEATLSDLWKSVQTNLAVLGRIEVQLRAGKTSTQANLEFFMWDMHRDSMAAAVNDNGLRTGFARMFENFRRIDDAISRLHDDPPEGMAEALRITVLERSAAAIEHARKLEDRIRNQLNVTPS